MNRWPKRCGGSANRWYNYGLVHSDGHMLYVARAYPALSVRFVRFVRTSIGSELLRKSESPSSNAGEDEQPETTHAQGVQP